MEPAAEKRKHRRHSVNIQGIFSSDTVRGEEGLVLDLSIQGCRMSIPSSISIAPQATIELQIRPRQSSPIFVPSAVVRWSMGSAFGVQFQELAVHDSKRLTHLLGAITS